MHDVSITASSCHIASLQVCPAPEPSAVEHWTGFPPRKRGLYSASCRLPHPGKYAPGALLTCTLCDTAGADAMAHLNGGGALSLAQLQALAAAGAMGMDMYGNAYPTTPRGYPGMYPPPGGYYWPPPGPYWTPGPSSVAGAPAAGAGPVPVPSSVDLELRLNSAPVASTRTSVDRGSGDASGDLLPCLPSLPATSMGGLSQHAALPLLPSPSSDGSEQWLSHAYPSLAVLAEEFGLFCSQGTWSCVQAIQEVLTRLQLGGPENCSRRWASRAIMRRPGTPASSDYGLGAPFLKYTQRRYGHMPRCCPQQNKSRTSILAMTACLRMSAELII